MATTNDTTLPDDDKQHCAERLTRLMLRWMTQSRHRAGGGMNLALQPLPKVVGPFPGPCASGSYVHRTAHLYLPFELYFCILCHFRTLSRV
jgi:hypothetical protein